MTYGYKYINLSDWLKELEEGNVVMLAEFINRPHNAEQSHWKYSSQPSLVKTLQKFYSSMISGLVSENVRKHIMEKEEEAAGDPYALEEQAKSGKVSFPGILPRAFEKLGYLEQEVKLSTEEGEEREELINDDHTTKLTDIIEDKGLNSKIRECARECRRKIIGHYK